jgi:predicted DNA-binding protein
MTDKEETQIQTAIRIPESLLERIDKVAERMSQPGTQITRADVHRQAIYGGLEVLEKELKKR